MKNTYCPAEVLLKELIRSRGVDYLREGGGRFFVNAFAEMGGEKQDVRLLRYLTECGGHKDLLDSAAQTPAKQRACYSQTVKKLCDQTLIPEALAHRVCGMFWKAVYGQEPPIAPQEPKKNPAVEPKPIQAPVLKSEMTGLTPEELYRHGMRCFKAPNLSLRQWWPNAVEWLEAAAAQNHLEAQIQLGFMYSWRETKEELGIRDADSRSAFWFRKAAEQGDTNAMVHLSWYYRDGTGVEQDYKQALYWCHKAAEKNDTTAMDELRYLYGYRLNKPELALDWCKKAAELGRADSQWRLGTMYEEGFGTDTDYEKALYWYRKAAVQGDGSAAKRIPEIEKKLKERENIAAFHDSPSFPLQDIREPYAHKQEKEHLNQDPLHVWKRILKGLSIAQIILSIAASIMAVILAIVQKEWTTALFAFVHIFYIYEAKTVSEIKKEPGWRYITAVLLLFLALIFTMMLMATAASGDWALLALMLCIFGSSPLLARFGLETLIGCRLKES